MSWIRYLGEEVGGDSLDLPPRAIDAALLDAARYFWEAIRGRWPVATGASLDAWEYGPRDGDIAVWNDLDYAEHVHSQPQYGGPPGLADRLWSELFGSILRTYRDSIDEQLALEQRAQLGEKRGLTREQFRPTRRIEPAARPTPRTIVPPAAPESLARVAARLASGAEIDRARARVVLSLMSRYIRSGELSGRALDLVRSGRLGEAVTVLVSEGKHRAAQELQRISTQL